MGCSGSHLRPFLRRCRRRRSKKDEASVTPKNELMIEQGMEMDGGHDLLGLQFLGSGAVKNPANKSDGNSSGFDQPFCVPLLAQSEASTSQLDFFKMLDAKIEEGPDYDPEEAEVEFERHKERNLHVWRKGIQSQSLGNRREPAPIARCHWDEDGD